MASPNLIDVMNISGGKMEDKKESGHMSRKNKKVIKAAEADKKVAELTAKDEAPKKRSQSEVRNKLYGDPNSERMKAVDLEVLNEKNGGGVTQRMLDVRKEIREGKK